jgi:acyl-CoA reductase-like NAD-dependent aldehyde dehydrogenase
VLKGRANPPFGRFAFWSEGSTAPAQHVIAVLMANTSRVFGVTAKKAAADRHQSIYRATIVGRFFHQGQICMSTNRVIVDAKIHDVFVDRFVAQVKSLKYSDPNDPAVAIGPIINKKQLQSHLARIAGAKTEGAEQILGGEPQGQVLPPHVFIDVRNDMKLAREEAFGPIAPTIKVNSEDEALRVANDTEFGLSSAVFTRTKRGEFVLRWVLRLV